MPILQLVQNGVCEELKFCLLHDKQHLLLQLFWILQLSEKCDSAARGAIESCNQLAERGFATAVCPHKPYDLMHLDGKTDTGKCAI